MKGGESYYTGMDWEISIAMANSFLVSALEILLKLHTAIM